MKNITYIILLNHNGSSDTCDCILSLQKMTATDFKIIVVDNSSDIKEFDTICEFVKNQQIPFVSFLQNEDKEINNEQIILIKAKENKGFAHGNNIALRFGMMQNNAAYFWILNNDTAVDPEALNELKAYHSQHPKTILGSKLLYFYNNETIQAVGGSFNQTFYISEHVGEGKSKNVLKKDLPSIDYPHGASMFVSKLFVEEVGLLNEDFFLYYEELDWVYRAKHKGYKPDWCEKSIVYHKEGATIGSSYKKKKSIFSETQLFISRKKFIKKYYSLSFKFYFSSLLLILNRLRKGQFTLANQLIKITFNDVK